MPEPVPWLEVNTNDTGDAVYTTMKNGITDLDTSSYVSRCFISSQLGYTNPYLVAQDHEPNLTYIPGMKAHSRLGGTGGIALDPFNVDRWKRLADDIRAAVEVTGSGNGYILDFETVITNARLQSWLGNHFKLMECIAELPQYRVPVPGGGTIDAPIYIYPYYVVTPGPLLAACAAEVLPRCRLVTIYQQYPGSIGNATAEANWQSGRYMNPTCVSLAQFHVDLPGSPWELEDDGSADAMDTLEAVIDANPDELYLPYPGQTSWESYCTYMSTRP